MRAMHVDSVSAALVDRQSDIATFYQRLSSFKSGHVVLVILSRDCNLTFIEFQLHASIKLKPMIEDGAGHVLESLRLNTEVQLSPKERTAVMSKLRNNTYFGHPEAVILSMLGM